MPNEINFGGKNMSIVCVWSSLELKCIQLLFCKNVDLRFQMCSSKDSHWQGRTRGIIYPSLRWLRELLCGKTPDLNLIRVCCRLLGETLPHVCVETKYDIILVMKLACAQYMGNGQVCLCLFCTLWLISLSSRLFIKKR